MIAEMQCYNVDLSLCVFMWVLWACACIYKCMCDYVFVCVYVGMHV